MRVVLPAILVACGSGSQPAPAPATSKPASVSVTVDASPVETTADAALGEAPDEDGHAGDHVHDACEDRAKQILMSPPLPAAADERDLVIELRRRATHEACEDGWTTRTLAERLDAIDDLAVEITSARKKPRGCAQVVAFHYADANWRGRLDGFSSSEREQMITRSRELMAKACNAEAWSDLLRACILADGNAIAAPSCFDVSGKGLSWDYPAAGSVTSLGIAECDDYGAALAQITSCTKLPAYSRDKLRRSYDEMQAHLAGLRAAERAKLASGCRAGRDAIQQAAAGAGC